jgi:tetratricopeptide (TPR) repeat protein
VGALNFWQKTLLVVLCVAGLDKQVCSAQVFPKDPAKWWPDPSTGLMWAEHGYSSSKHSFWVAYGLNWQQSVDYCAALKLGGFSGWRIPTLDEVKGIAYTRHGVVTTSGHGCPAGSNLDPKSDCVNTLTTSDPHDEPSIKIPEWGDDPMIFTWVWTSTPSPYADKSAWIVGPYVSAATVVQTDDHRNRMDPFAALCVRPMDADTLQIAKDAQVSIPIPDLQTLKAYVMLNKARLAYQAGQYQDSLTQAQNALSIQGGLQTAYWGMGLSYGMLGQWDLAIANLNSAFKLNKNYQGDVYATLQWAKASTKAAKKGQKPKIKGKEWKSPEWKGPPWS